ncbi:PD40 domain-containing protein, partial [Candidatus Saccharibacteria bacterium]|nr:PD40 domain-containing protein [Candidatus Saccharibacteria bacterium]
MKFIFRFHRVVLVLLFIVAIFVPQQPTGANSYFGGNGKITFYSPVTLDDTGQEVYTINPDGTGLAQVTNNSLADANPQWAPSGTKVAFDHYVDATNQQDIYTQSVASDGSGSGTATVVSGANTPAREFDPSWNPDGDTIAFHRCHLDVSDDCDSPYQIYTIPSAGAVSATRITVDELYADTEPTWRKDGNYLTYTHRLIDDTNNTCDSDTPGDPTDDNCDDLYSIAIATPTAGASSVVIDSAASASDSLGSPQWSPTENKVVYVKNGNIWIYNQDIDTKAQLTSTGDVSAPTWSPDGRYIATGGSSQMRFFSATTGALVHTTTISSGGSTDFTPAEGAIEVDWARATAPPDTVHECTTYVNETCTDFIPEIPSDCQTVTTNPSHGTPSYDNGHIFTPVTDYVGEDSYVYTYED